MSRYSNVSENASVPAATWRMLSQRRNGDELPGGLDAVWDAASGALRRTFPRTRLLMRRERRILSMDGEFASLSDAALRDAAETLRERFRRRRDEKDDLDRAFALVREVAARKLGLKPFAVQVAAALGLESGCIVEMATGEGKTLAATMPATVAGWRGRGCHVITVNDYLARRDAEWMRPVYEFCGLLTEHIEQSMPPPQRRCAYSADITYCTNKEVTADFLRDRLAMGNIRGLSDALIDKIATGRGPGADRLVQRGLDTAIVDEADSVLIDEAVTPLIISGDAPNPEQVEAFQEASQLAEDLRSPEHFRIDRRHKEVRLTTAGQRRLAELTEGMGGLWSGARRREELVTQALTARWFFLRDSQYVVQDGKVVIVDEFTGRMMPDREWRDGLHQAVEAKEDLTVNPPKDTYARISFQRFFRLYRNLSGMTGTAAEAWREFWQIYHLPIAVIPTNRPCRRRILPDRVFACEDAKWRAVVAEMAEMHRLGRPVLVGTRSVRASEHLSELLRDRELGHEVLNAVRHSQEAKIVARAGQPGRITVATNMAGRGTDIQLGQGVAELGGLHVLATERHEAGRIDRQLFGRSARQGDPGSAGAIVSLEDELPRRYAPHMTRTLRARSPETDREISSPVTRRVFDVAQRRAERLALRQRKAVLRTDNWLDEHLGFAGREG
ncbi:MAG: prepilin peptidase [Planctomycetota bacterium]